MGSPSVISGLLILNFVRSLFFTNMAALLVKFHRFCVKSMVFLLTQVNFESRIQSAREAHGGEGRVSLLNGCCRSCKRSLFSSAGRGEEGAMESLRGAPIAADIQLVMGRLGMRVEEEDEAEKDGRCRDCFFLETAKGVLEEKEVGAEELAEAFSVFDRDGDGYIRAEELQDVMSRLGLEEGVELEDCRRMIVPFDEDGDGRVDLAEFKKLLESAT